MSSEPLPVPEPPPLDGSVVEPPPELPLPDPPVLPESLGSVGPESVGPGSVVSVRWAPGSMSRPGR